MIRRVLFGEHSTQAPAIAQFIDRSRFDPTFAELAMADFEAFDLVVPLSVAQIDQVRPANANGVRRAVLPRAELVALCDDKLACNQWLIAQGFGAHVPALLGPEPQSFPYIRKSRQGNFGAGCVMVRDAAAAAALGPIDETSFHQHAVAGADEYVLHLVRIDGQIRFRLCYRYDMGTPLAVRGGAESARTVVPAEAGDALPLCTAILGAMGYEGTCCFNYKLEDGQPQILEINPRFGGSLVGEVSAYLQAHVDALGPIAP
ncbi:ATP-grasp domain-containing protein [Sphingomonas sp. PL-96]|uniref:ATP-grasp domain-containing protein n=1 Tax=Sphingomonas sp. PL-96 TaxID=2887201 RepID=UPI001E53FA3A|nr:ATP-grasp domain-containing protein [Sphingomonas sp. PL-96]MCC2976012.1 ATP-grasp domain-containing protein [Sphingomonas sp. PL-96]